MPKRKSTFPGMPPSRVASLTSKGKLTRAMRPAVYLDTSVLIEYWAAFGLEGGDPPFPRLEPWQEAVRALLKTTPRFLLMGQVRQAASSGEGRCLLVTSALAVLETIGWYARMALRNAIVDTVGLPAADRHGSTRAIGDALTRVSSIARGKAAVPKGRSVSEFRDLLQMVSLDRTRMYHGLDGVALADIRYFTLDAQAADLAPADLMYQQVGAADLMHVLFAHHLGCDYFASLDEDFKRAREVVEDSFGLKLLASAEELQKRLRAPR